MLRSPVRPLLLGFAAFLLCAGDVSTEPVVPMLSAETFARTVEHLLGVPVSTVPPPADPAPEAWLAAQQASPDLLAYFRDTARAAVRRALEATGPVVRIEAESLRVPAARMTVANLDDAVLIHPDADQPVAFTVATPDGGAFLARIYAASAYVEANLYDIPGRSIEIRLDGMLVGRDVLPFLGASIPWVEHPVTLTPGSHVLEVRTIAELDQRRSVVALDALELRTVAPTPSPARAALVPCAGVPDRACVREALARFVPRAFRREANAGEVERYVALAERARAMGAEGDEALALAFEAVLASPSFVFVAPGEGAGGRARALTARLAQVIWHHGPDATLEACAAQGIEVLLGEGACGLAAQTRRMLDHPDAMAFARSFSEAWLGLGAARSITPPPMLFLGFSERVREAAFVESAGLVASLVREDRPFTEALTSSRALLDQRLASLYGVNAAAMDVWTDLPPGRRGVLGQTSVLLATSFPLRTSTTRRGAWMLSRLLCREPGPPAQAALETTDLQRPGDASAALGYLRTQEGCRNCHAVLDPLGDALEVFDPVGRRREAPGGRSTAGSLADPALTWTDAASLGAALARHPEAARCFARRLFAHTVGRAPGSADAVTLDEVTRDVQLGTRRALVTLARSAAFRWEVP